MAFNIFKAGKQRRRITKYFYMGLVVFSISCSNILAITYTYDDLNRLIKVEYESGTIIEYEYDSAGNITQVTTKSKNGTISEGNKNNDDNTEPDRKKEKDESSKDNVHEEKESSNLSKKDEKNHEEERKDIDQNSVDKKQQEQYKQNNHVVMKLNDQYMIVNGKKIKIDAKIFISKNNRLMVPVRYIAYALGIDSDQIIWNSEEKSITIQGKKEVKLSIGKEYMLVDGQVMQLNEQVQIINGRTYLPIGDLCKCFEVQYSWDNIEKQLTIG